MHTHSKEKNNTGFVEVVQHPSEPVDVWFNDGNLIVRTDEKSFRIYCGILECASPVFRDIIALAKKNSESEKSIDGCLAVCVQVSDAAADMSFFLMSLHDPEFFLPPPAKTTFAVAAGIFKLSIKYDVPFLRRRTLHHLAVVYPTTLADWDAAPEWLMPYIFDHFSAIQLARQYGIVWIQPMAVYHCMSKPIDDKYEFLQTCDLSDTDRIICTSALPRLKASQITCVMATGMKLRKATKCSANGECNRLSTADTLASLAAHSSDDADPLATSDKALGGYTLCTSCRIRSRLIHSAERNIQWDAIPDMVQCDPWERLSAMREAATVAQEWPYPIC